MSVILLDIDGGLIRRGPGTTLLGPNEARLLRRGWVVSHGVPRPCIVRRHPVLVLSRTPAFMARPLRCAVPALLYTLRHPRFAPPPQEKKAQAAAEAAEEAPQTPPSACRTPASHARAARARRGEGDATVSRRSVQR